MNGSNLAAPQKIKIAERRAMALELRKQGGSYRAISERLRQEEGISSTYSVGQAYTDVQAELQRIATENAEEAAQILRLDLERLDTMLTILWPKLLKGDYFAFDRVLAILDRRARYFGLTGPRFVNTTQINVQQAHVAVCEGQQVSQHTAIQQFTQIMQMSVDELPALIAHQHAQLAAYSAVLDQSDEQD